MRRKNSKTAQIGGIFIVAVMAFAAVGASIAHWEETLTINGLMTTDDIDPVFYYVDSNDDPADMISKQLDPEECGHWTSGGMAGIQWLGERRDKDVGSTEIYTSNDDQTLNIVVNDAYPCYYSHVFYKIINKGSCPVLINSPLMLETLSIQLDPTDPSTYHEIDIEDMKLEIDTWYFVKYWENNNNVWRANVVEGPVDNPENYDFSMMPTGSDLVHKVNVQLDPWSWKDNPAAHMENSDEYLGQIPGDLCIHFENGCMQDTVYDFKFKMTFWNWPEFCTPDEVPPVKYPEEGNVYIGYEDWGNGDFDYNDFGMYFNAIEYYQGQSSDDLYLTGVTMVFTPEIYDSGGNHLIHIARNINGDSTVTVTRTQAAYGSETPQGTTTYTGDVDVVLFDTSKYAKPSKQIYQNTGEMVTVDLSVEDPSLNPKTTPSKPRWDVDSFWGNYDPWEVGTSGIINGVEWHIEDEQMVTAVNGPHSEVLDTRLIGETLPYILVVNSNNWVPPYEDSSISGPRTTTDDYGPYGYFYDYYHTNGADHPNWFDEITDSYVGLGGLSWS